MRKIPDYILAAILFLLHTDEDTGHRKTLWLKYANKETADFIEEFYSRIETGIIPKYNPDRKNSSEEDKTEHSLIQALEKQKSLLTDEFVDNEQLKQESIKIDNQIKNISVHKNFRQPFVISKTDTSVSISIPETNTSVLEGLKSYLKELSRDNIEYETNTLKWTKQVSDFKASINKPYTLTNYNIDNTEYISVIAYGFVTGKIKIKNISFNIAEDMIMNHNHPLCYYSDHDNELQLNEEFTGYEFSCCLDLTNFFASQGAKGGTDKELSQKDRINQAICNLVQQAGNNRRKSVSYESLKQIIRKERADDADIDDKRIQSYISDANTYMKENSYKYCLGRKETNCYPVTYCISQEEKEKLHLESLGK